MLMTQRNIGHAQTQTQLQAKCFVPRRLGSEAIVFVEAYEQGVGSLAQRLYHSGQCIALDNTAKIAW